MSIFYKQTHVCLDRGIHEVWRELDLAVSFLGGTNKACIFHNFAGRTISTFFNHTLNEIPQSLFPITRFDKKTPLGCPLGRLKFSMASLSNTSSITFWRILSVTFKAFTSVESVYDGCKIEKLDCVGHVQKRMALKATKRADGKTIGGKGNLTEGKIKQLQKYYGLAIHQNTLSQRNQRLMLQYTQWKRISLHCCTIVWSQTTPENSISIAHKASHPGASGSKTKYFYKSCVQPF